MTCWAHGNEPPCRDCENEEHWREMDRRAYEADEERSRLYDEERRADGGIG